MGNRAAEFSRGYRSRALIWCLTLSAALALALAASAGAAEAAVTVTVLGQPAPVTATPVVQDGILFVAARDLTGPLGFGLRYEPGPPKSIVVSGSGEISLRVGDVTIRTPTRDIRSPAAPFISSGGAFMVPVRGFCRAVGAAAVWESQASRLSICARLTDLRVAPEDGRVVLAADTTFPVPFQTTSDATPRALLTLKGCVLDLERPEFPVRAWGIEEVHASQASSAPVEVRVAVTLSKPKPVAVLSQNPSAQVRVQIGVPEDISQPPVLPRLLKLCFARNQMDEAELRVVADAPIGPYSTLLVGRPARLMIDVGDVIMEIGEVARDIPDALVTRVTASQKTGGPFVARIVLNLVGVSPYSSALEAGGKELVIRFAKAPVTGRVVVVDAGHGGEDPGAVGPSGLKEKDVNLDVAMRLQKMLLDSGINAFATRTSDVLIPLYQRAELANDLAAEVFVSVHSNAWVTPNARQGSEVWYGNDYSLALAHVAQDELVRRLRRRDGGVHRNIRLVVTRETGMPAIIAELAYINHKDEESLLASSEFRQLAASALCAAIVRYLESTPPPEQVPAAPGSREATPERGAAQEVEGE